MYLHVERHPGQEDLLTLQLNKNDLLTLCDKMGHYYYKRNGKGLRLTEEKRGEDRVDRWREKAR